MNSRQRKPYVRARTVLLACGVAGLLTACGSVSAGDGTTTGTIPVGSRPAPIIHRPAGLSFSHKVPLLVGLPGLGGSPTSFHRGTQFDPIADRNGFVVAYLGSDNQAHPWSPHGDDLAYVSSMIKQLTVSQNIDPSRVYVTGFSAGAAFTYIVACKLSSQVAGIAAVSAVMNTVVTAPCALAHPMSVLTIIGSRDGAINGFAPRVLSDTATAAAWRAKNNCPSSQPSLTGRVGSAQEQEWASCADGTAVGLYVIQGGIHIWPDDAEFNLPPSNPDGQFNASSAIWSFFSKHSPGPNAVGASIASVRVKKVKKASEVVINFRLSEPVIVACALALGRRKVMRSLQFKSAGVARAVLAVPRGTKAGRRLLTCAFQDPYGRRLKLQRKVALR